MPNQMSWVLAEFRESLFDDIQEMFSEHMTGIGNDCHAAVLSKKAVTAKSPFRDKLGIRWEITIHHVNPFSSKTCQSSISGLRKSAPWR